MGTELDRKERCCRENSTGDYGLGLVTIDRDVSPSDLLRRGVGTSLSGHAVVTPGYAASGHVMHLAERTLSGFIPG